MFKIKAAEQSVHLTLGILRQSQAVSYALSFFWLDGFAVPAPAQVTQTVGRFLAKHKEVVWSILWATILLNHNKQMTMNYPMMNWIYSKNQ
ncbi:MAG: hypothetical protein U0X74_01915 [Anaerolineales bacterium]